jgi:hypothetical protein
MAGLEIIWVGGLGWSDRMMAMVSIAVMYGLWPGWWFV